MHFTSRADGCRVPISRRNNVFSHIVVQGFIIEHGANQWIENFWLPQNAKSHSFTFPPLVAQWGKNRLGVLDRHYADGIVVIKFTKSRKMLRHLFLTYVLHFFFA